MNEQDSPISKELDGPRIVTRYSRPIDFIKESEKPFEIPKKSQGTNGDDIASFYKQLTAPNGSSSKTEKDKKRGNAQHDETIIFCEACDCNIPQTEFKRHITSTSHMVSSKDYAEPINKLILNSKNIGYKMMETQGWKYEEGLGPAGQGRRQPISTVLKKDRLCVGHVETGKKAVTHTYNEIEKKAIQRQRLERLRQKPSGKQIAKNAKRESEERKRLLAYMNR